jgi:DNA repair photolyase
MPGIIRALAEQEVPFSILTKGTLLRRDLPLLQEVAAHCDVSLATSIAIFDDELQQSLEPGTPSTAARLATVRLVRERGLDCAVFLAPVLPGLTDSPAHLDRALGMIKEAGGTAVFWTALRLGADVKDWFLAWLARERPSLVGRYAELYGAGSAVPDGYRRLLAARMAVLLKRHGLADASDRRREESRQTAGGFSLDRNATLAKARVRERPAPASGEQPQLF